jgi:hypothetical protein
MAEYGGTVIWAKEGEVSTPLEVAELPISGALTSAIKKWAAAYDDTLNHDDPTASGFGSESLADEFDAEGRRIWQALRDELGPDFKISYFSEKDRQLLD